MKALNREILRLALPSILANITVPIVGMVDIAVAGHIRDAGATAAFIGGISIGSMLFDLLYWSFGFLRAGTGGLTAQALGARDWRECGRILVRSTGLALIIALLILAIQKPFCSLAFLAVKCSPEVKELALKYFFIRIWAAPATLSLMALRGWFIGMQDSFSSMTVDLTVNFVNIAASIALTLGIGNHEGMGFPGIALGTVIAQYSGLILACATLALKYRSTLGMMEASDFAGSLEGSKLRRFFSINGDFFLRSLGITAIYIGFTVISARFGDLMLASSAIMMKLLMVFSFFTDGFAYAGEALTGRFIGARSPGMVRSTVKGVFVWSMAIAVAFVFIYAGAGIPMLNVMTSDEGVVEACRQFIPWLLLMPPLGCAAFTWDGIYQGATASRPVRDAMLGALLVFFAVWAVGKAFLPDSTADPDSAAIHILMGAYFAHLLFRTLYLTIRYKKDILENL